MVRRLYVAAVCAAGLTPGLLAQSSPAPDQRSQPAFRSTTRLIQVTVVVRDNKGRPITGLKAGDFRLVEAGKEQPIALFSEESRPEQVSVAAPMPRGTFTNRLGATAESGVTILLYDRLNTSSVHQQQARDHIITFLKQLDPGARIGFYLLDGDGVRVLHDVTRDASSLLAVLNRAPTATSGALDGSEATLRVEGEEIDPKLIEMVARSEMAVQGHFMKIRGQATAGALEVIGRRLAGVRGRKSVIWVSSGFPMLFFDGITLQNMSPEVRAATRALSTSDVTIYPVDARGLVGAFSSRPADKRQQFTNLSTVMEPLDSSLILAEQTGGRVYYNTNDLGNAIARAMDDTSHSYVLGYYPANERWDGRFRSIKVSTSRRGAAVRHRSGYYAHPPDRSDTASLRNAMLETLHAPLDSTGITLTARVAPGAGPDAYTIDLRLEPESITLDRKGDLWTATLDVAIGQGLPDGRVFSSADRSISLTLTDADRSRLATEGVTLTQVIALRDDAHQIRVVVRDRAGSQTGSLTIPADRIRRLPW